MKTLADMSLDERLEFLTVLQKRAEAVKTLGCAMYRPHFKQDLFHQHGHIKYRYARTGNRFGKSDMGSAEDVAWALGYRPWYGDEHPARYCGIPKRPTKGIILCTDWEKAREVFTNEVDGEGQGKLWKWIPKSELVRRDTNHGNINQVTVKSKWGGESTIGIATVAGFKLNNQRGESDWYDWIHVDEPIPKDMWDSYARGLVDRNGSAWFTCTPLREPWINRFFGMTARTPLEDGRMNMFSYENNGKFDRAVLIGKSTDNPFVSVEGIDSFVEGLSDSQRAARLFGKPLEHTGLVHPSFDDTHLYYEVPANDWRGPTRPPRDYTIRYALDPHPVTPHAVLFVATSPQGQPYFFDEIFESLDAHTLADRILAITNGYYVPTELADPSAFIESMNTKTSLADDFLEHGLSLEKASKDLNRGIIETNKFLEGRSLPGFQRGNYGPAVRPLFGAHLRRTIWEFENYVYDDPERRPDKPKDKDDHMMENLHRLVLSGLTYINPVAYDMPIYDRPNNLLVA